MALIGYLLLEEGHLCIIWKVKALELTLGFFANNKPIIERSCFLSIYLTTQHVSSLKLLN
jgi:hypothetical protein